MSQFIALSPESATGKARDLLEAVNARLGMVPSIMRANQYDYCVAALSAIGTTVGLTADQIRDSRVGNAM